MIFVLRIKNNIYLCSVKKRGVLLNARISLGKMRYSDYLLQGLIIDILTIFVDRK